MLRNPAASQWNFHISRKLVASFIAFFLAVALIVCFIHFFEDIQSWTDAHTEAIEDFLRRTRASPWAPVIVWGVYVLAGITFFPTTAVSLAVAAVFGFASGVVYGLSGALLSASLAFWAGQKIGGDRLKKLAPRSIEKIDKKLKKSGIAGIATLRLVVFAPYTLFNLVIGISSVRFRDYLIGSFIGMLPGFVARGMVGDSMMKIVLNPTWQSALYLSGGIAFWFAMVFCVHRVTSWQKAKA